MGSEYGLDKSQQLALIKGQISNLSTVRTIFGIVTVIGFLSLFAGQLDKGISFFIVISLICTGSQWLSLKAKIAYLKSLLDNLGQDGDR